MSLKKFVKISKVSNLSDARYCAGMMVDILGFDIHQSSEDYVSPTLFQEITNWVAGIQFAAECGGLSSNEVNDITNNYQVDFIQTDSLDVASMLGTRAILNWIISSKEDLHSLKEWLAGSNIQHIILDVANESLTSDTDSLLMANTDINWITGATISADNIESLNPLWTGIQLEGSKEDSPGLKDYDNVMDVLEALEID
ncbi:MAG: hypothetical protein JXQ90_03985 [Cyclobacteriaceae bacterium]